MMLKYVGGTFSPLAAAARVSFIDHIAGVSRRHPMHKPYLKCNSQSEMPDNWSQIESQSLLALPGCPCLARQLMRWYPNK